MPKPHDHEKWKERKTARSTICKDKQKTRASEKRKAPDAEPATLNKSRKKLSFLKSFKNALATQVIFSYAEANHIVNKLTSGALDDASNDDTSKY